MRSHDGVGECPPNKQTAVDVRVSDVSMTVNGRLELKHGRLAILKVSLKEGRKLAQAMGMATISVWLRRVWNLVSDQILHLDPHMV